MFRFPWLPRAKPRLRPTRDLEPSGRDETPSRLNRSGNPGLMRFVATPAAPIILITSVHVHLDAAPEALPALAALIAAALAGRHQRSSRIGT